MKTSSFGMKMCARSVLCAGIAAMAALLARAALAADYTFPTVNGDLASASDWGMSAIPGTADTVLISSPGTDYTIGQNVEFGNIRFPTNGTFAISAENVEVRIATNDYPLRMIDGQQNRHVTLKGGTWILNKARWSGLSKNSSLTLQDGAVLTNAAQTEVCRLAYSGAALHLKDSSRIHCGEFRINNTGSNGKLNVASGSKVVVGSLFYSDVPTATDYTKQVNTRAEVTGSGSEITCNKFRFGYKSSGHVLALLDGGKATCRADIRIGQGSSTDVRLVMTNAVFAAGSNCVVESSNLASGNGISAMGSTITVGGDFENAADGSRLDFQNVDFSVSGTLKLFPDKGKGCLVRFGGADGVWPNQLKQKADCFSSTSGNGNTLVIDDGFEMSATTTVKMMCHSSNSTLRVSGGARFSSPEKMVAVGYSDYNTSVSNMVEVLDGGIIAVDDFRLMGTGNQLVVSNGTLTTTGEGILLGYAANNAAYATRGARATLKGTTPRLQCTGGSVWLKNDMVLRFELPPQGYAQGFAPITASSVIFDSTAKLEVDYGAFLEHGGGLVSLMSFARDVSQKTGNGGVTFLQWLENQRAAMDLPNGCRLFLVSDGNTSQVMFRAGKPRGMTFSFR